LQLRQLDPFIGSLELRQVHMGNLQAFIARRRQDGVKTKTLNMALAVVRRVRQACPSRIVKICSGTEVVASRRTTPKPN
jgi:hypothetical protein